MKDVAVITGGSGDLAQAMTSRLLNSGMDVRSLGKDRLDVTSPESVAFTFKELRDVDLLICNAGLTSDQTLFAMTEPEWVKVMDVNLRGAFLCSREAAKAMVKKRSGHIIFVSSFSAFSPPVGQANYASAKAALVGMMKSMSVELGPRNIRVNVIVPGFLETKMTNGISDSIKRKVKERHTLGRFNTPQAVSEFIECLHLRMPHTSGQIFNLDSRILI